MDKVTLCLEQDGRVRSAAWYRHPPEGAVTVERAQLPKGDVTQYRYVDGTFIHDPLPVEPEIEQPAQTAEERIAALEAQSAMLTDCLLEMSEIVYGE